MKQPLIINAKQIKEKEVIRLKQEVDLLKKKTNNTPCLVIISCSNDAASENYIKNKVKLGQEVGIEVIVEKLPQETTQEELENLIFELNQCDNIDSMILQLPLYNHLDAKSAIEYISPDKDVDCFTSEKLGETIQGNSKTLPCTPKGVVKLLDEHMVELQGKDIIVLGRSIHVGQSLSILLTQRGATVTTCHSKTKDLNQKIHNADIVISCVGKQNLITSNMMKANSVLIGVGITVDKHGKQQTDYDIEDMKNSKCSLIGDRLNTTGILTVVSLIDNVIELYKDKYNLNTKE